MIIRREEIMLGVFIVVMLLTAGCTLGDVLETACEAAPDKDHCYQLAAVEGENPALCEKIVKDAPRSKCYVLLAQEYSNGTYCTMMKAGQWTYDKEDCYQLVALKTNNLAWCDDIRESYQSSGNDLNKRGVSREYCKNELQKTCSQPGQECCAYGKSSIVPPRGACYGDRVYCNLTTGKCLGES